MDENTKAALGMATFRADEPHAARGANQVARNFQMEAKQRRMTITDWLRCKQAWIGDARYHESITETMDEAADALESSEDALLEMLDVIVSNKGNRDPLYGKLREWRDRHKALLRALRKDRDFGD